MISPYRPESLFLRGLSDARLRLVLAVAICLAAGFVAPRRAAAQEVLDQQYVCPGPSELFYPMYTSQPSTQSFTPSQPNVDAVELRLLHNGGPATDTLTFLLRQGSTSGPILATRSIVITNPGPSPFWKRFDVTPPVAVVPGTRYVAQLSVTNAGSWMLGGTRCGDYLGGVATPTGPGDYNFRTYSATVCGDGVLGAGEACDLGAANGAGSCCTTSCTLAPAGATCGDDGNVCTSDVCDVGGVCTHPAGNPGTTCRAANGACDAAESCDGVHTTCPADVSLPDRYDDGECDAIDRCTNSGEQDFAAKAALTLVNVNTNTLAGDDKLKLTASFSLPAADTFATLAPDATGVQLLIAGSDGSTTLDATIPAGTYAKATKAGWTRSRNGRKWTYVDRSVTPPSGIGKVVLTYRDSSRDPRIHQVRVTITGTKADYPVQPGDPPMQVIVTLGDQSAAAAGICGESNFTAASCRFNGRGSTLTCKQ